MKRHMVRLRIPWSRMVVLGLCGCLWMPRASLAQRGSWELGLDMGAEFSSLQDINPFGPDSVRVHETVVDIPQGAFRAGYFLTDALSLESSLGVSWILENPRTNVVDWQVRAGLGATYAISPSSRVSPFLSSGMLARYTSEQQFFGIPITGGVRIRVGESQSIRIQSGVIATFNTGPFEQSGAFWTIPVRIGWSLNTKAAPGGTQQ